MTPDEYAELVADIQAAVVAKIAEVENATTPNLSKVLDRDPVNFDETEWLGALKSDADVDEHGEKRVNAWLVTFAASDDLESDTVRSIEPTVRLRIQKFYAHDFGTTSDNSEMRNRTAILKVQFELARMARPAKTNNYGLLPMRVRLARLGGEIVHRSEGELSFGLQPINVR